jgi:hypothetical protein
MVSFVLAICGAFIGRASFWVVKSLRAGHRALSWHSPLAVIEEARGGVAQAKSERPVLTF